MSQRRSAALAWPAHRTVLALGLLITIAFVVLSRDFGTTRDEPIRNAFGEHVLAYWAGGDALFPGGPHLRVYGGLFDVSALLVHGVVGGDLWTNRHYVNAAFGGLGILAVGLFAARLFGTPAGLATMVLLALSPRFMAHAMNNPKDAPFAALCSVALLSFTLLRAAPPFVTWPGAIGIGLALALPLNVRPAALLYWGYLGLAVGALTVRARDYSVRTLSAVAARLAVITVVMLLAGCATWPWAQGNPFVRPFEALLVLGDFRWPGRVLFQGQVVSALNVPPTYLPVMLSLTNPPVVLAGMLASVVALGASRRQRLLALGLWFVVLFPVVTAIVKGSTLYNGWRHVLFIYPPLVVLAVLGWQFAWERARSRSLRAVVAGLFLVGCAEPLWFMARNHPHQVVYFNALTGGPKGAAGRFELDYWANSYLQAMKWCAELAERSGTPLVVAGTPQRVVRFDARRFPGIAAARLTRGEHHLELRLLRSELGPSAADRRGVLHVVRMSDGTPLAIVRRGPRWRQVQELVMPHLERTAVAEARR